jgi:copper transport protein
VLTATYRLVSGDGHPVAGGLVFQVGSGGPAPSAAVKRLLAGAQASPGTASGYAAVRALGYAALALALGGLLFLLLCWLPTLRAVAGPEPRWRAAADALLVRWRTAWRAAAGLGAATSLAGLVYQAATAAGTSFTAALDPSVMQQVLDTRGGRAWLARLVAWLVIAGIVEIATRPRRQVARLQRVALGADGYAVAEPSRGAVGALAAGAAALMTTSALAGHAAVQSPVALLLSLNVVHVAAMCAWLGGLAGIVALLPAATAEVEPHERTELLATVLSRFSAVALAAVGVLVLTGVGQTVAHVDRLDALTGTAFGRAIVIKTALLGLLIGLGALNRQRTLPRLRALAAGREHPGRAGRVLRTTVRTEIALLAAVLTVTGALASYRPPSSQARPAPVEHEVSLGPIDAELTVASTTTGATSIDLYLFGAGDGLPVRHVHRLALAASLPGVTPRPVPIAARAVGAGHFVARTVGLAPAGLWRVRVALSAYGSDRHTATVVVPVR